MLSNAALPSLNLINRRERRVSDAPAHSTQPIWLKTRFYWLVLTSRKKTLNAVELGVIRI
jgi:hypothetical protein